MKKTFTKQDIENFTSDKRFAYVGVPADEKKFGAVLFRDLLKAGYDLLPVNPKLEEAQGRKCYKNVADLPDDVKKLFVITPKSVSASIAEDAAQKGITQIWMQQGAADEETVELAKSKGMTVIHDECLYMYTQATGIHGFHKWLRKVFNSLPK